MLKGFKDFLMRGNIINLAVAVVIGAAFTAVVSQFTASFLQPLIALVGGGGGVGGTVTVDGETFDWGAFVNAVLTFVLTAAVVYVVVVLPVKRLGERRKRGEEAGPAQPTEIELLVEIRDLLRARQGPGPVGDPAGSLPDPAPRP